MIIAFSRAIGPIRLDCVISEDHTAEIEITSNPIETGAEVNDHAYVMPKRVTLEIADGNAAATYNALVRFQESRVPFVLITGFAIYRNMMIKAINVRRDKTYSRVLNGSVDLQEVIIVDTSGSTSIGGSVSFPSGNPGGALSILSARPAPSRASDASTIIRVSGTVQRGDMPAVAAPLFGKGSDVVKNYNTVREIFG